MELSTKTGSVDVLASVVALSFNHVQSFDIDPYQLIHYQSLMVLQNSMTFHNC